MKLFGLIGYPLGHSFSKNYFSEKFERENILDCQFELFEIEKIDSLRDILDQNPEIRGLSVTIPHKQAVIPLLDELDPACQQIGAVNCIRVKDGKLTGFNTDYIGFKTSLSHWLRGENPKALVLGTGGASKAVKQALHDLGIAYLSISRTETNDTRSYSSLAAEKDLIQDYPLIINCTPLGTYPHTDQMPPIPEAFFRKETKVYDLVYNPSITRLMQACLDQQGEAKNGLEMLELQAEAAWELWNS